MKCSKHHLLCAKHRSVGADTLVFNIRVRIDLRALPEKPKAILSCGPLPMLRALKAYAAEEGIPLWVSMEERMACGIGACLGCITESTEVDAHSNVKNKRVCADGPVFRAEEVVL